MVKLLHTADWHIGLKARHAGDRAPRLREERIRTITRIVDMARAERVDAVLVAGDLFDHPDVEQETVRKVVNALESCPVPVYAIPGNHDPLTAEGVWDSPAWGTSKVQLVREPAEIPLFDGVSLFPCPTLRRIGLDDPTAWIPSRQSGDRSVRIGLAHGALDLGTFEGVNSPIAPDRAERAGLNYLALGDWHGTRRQGECTAYSGTPEPTKFGESDPGNALIIEIPTDGGKPQVESRRVAGHRWASCERTIRTLEDVAAIQAETASLGDPANLCLELKVSLAPQADAAVREAFFRALERLQACFWLRHELDERFLRRGAERIPDGIPRTLYDDLADAQALEIDPDDAEEARLWMAIVAAKEGR